MKIHERELLADNEQLKDKLSAIQSGQTPPASPAYNHNYNPSGPLLGEPTEMEVSTINPSLVNATNVEALKSHIRCVCVTSCSLSEKERESAWRV